MSRNVKHHLFRNGRNVESFPTRAAALKHLRWLLATWYPCCSEQGRAEVRAIRWEIHSY